MLLYENPGKSSPELDWQDDLRLIYFKRGHFVLRLNLREYEVMDERLCVINIGDLFRLESIDNGEVYILEFSLRELMLLDSDDRINQEFFVPIRDKKKKLREMVTVSDLGYFEIIRAVNDLVRRIREYGKRIPHPEGFSLTEPRALGDTIYLKAELFRILSLFELNGLIRDTKEKEDPQTENIKKIISYIRDNFSEKIYVRDLSGLAGLNEQYFIRFFKSVTGLSPIDYINRYRVKRAMKELWETDDRAYEIAKRCGFKNIGNFINIFRDFSGTTPNKYRKLKRGEIK